MTIESIMKILEFSTSGFFTFIAVYSLLAMVLFFFINGIIKIVSKFFKLLQILLRGYPPAYLYEDLTEKEQKEENDYSLEDSFHKNKK